MEGWMETAGSIGGGAIAMKVIDYLIGRWSKKDDAAVKLRDELIGMARQIIVENTKGMSEKIERLEERNRQLEKRIDELEGENRALRDSTCAQCSFRAK
jgi:archaellum component FlaC